MNDTVLIHCPQCKEEWIDEKREVFCRVCERNSNFDYFILEATQAIRKISSMKDLVPNRKRLLTILRDSLTTIINGE